MFAFLCENCGCVHGWCKHPAVKEAGEITRHPYESIWKCPQCNIVLSDGPFEKKQYRIISQKEIEEGFYDEKTGVVFKNGVMRTYMPIRF